MSTKLSTQVQFILITKIMTKNNLTKSNYICTCITLLYYILSVQIPLLRPIGLVNLSKTPSISTI